ncbi:RNA polymerase sigma factor [Phocaeicola plebeius]|jgi:RNA polymerase sigma-70 factor (family 1)|uniref:RNA polymerase sigma factor n=1 Tax=Phocaeicola plebeius TaxID=310297 RepID=UPI001D91AD9C|nr:RNA polymerase sigma-70 factor [Phocaeicola plebeius]MBS4809801.1 RNA polymerase sigma-70 factor [Bacteroides sp.]MBS4824866.1 RNA polymerase sigma-70 factor [Bacteroides sp.]
MFKSANNQISDTELFHRIQKGDEKAFTIAYELYNKLIYVLSYRYLMDEERAKDVVQYVFVKLWEYRAELNIGISLKNFLFTMAKNYILNLIRNENTALEKQYEIAQQVLGYEDDLVEKLERREQMSLFYQALAKLPEQKKRICVMKIREEMSNKEIAERLNVSINTVKTHYAEALKLLRRELLKLLMIIIILMLSAH